LSSTGAVGPQLDADVLTASSGGPDQYASPDWVKAAPLTTPSGYDQDGSAYDPATKTIVLAEYCAGTVLCTWLWNGSNWSEAAPSNAPSARLDSSVAWDPQLNDVVLFGGYATATGALLNDTWAWNGSTWTQLSTVGAPPVRYDASMAWDTAENEMVLFGGVGATIQPYQGSYLDDTWFFSNNTWTTQTIGYNEDQVGATMAYSASTQQIVMFGGVSASCNQAGQDCTYSELSSTFTLAPGTGWEDQVAIGGTPPVPRTGASMAYDTELGAVVLFGGTSSSGTTLSDTWAFTGTEWEAAGAIASPPGTTGAALSSYDPSGELVLFGGAGTTATWVYDTNQPTITTTVVNTPTSGSFSAGDVADIDSTLTNVGSAPTSPNEVNITLGGDLRPQGTTASIAVVPTSSVASTTLPLTGALAAPCAAPVSCGVHDQVMNVANLVIPSGDTAIVQVNPIVDDVGGTCTSDPVTVESFNLYGGSAPASTTAAACQGGLGLENWWTYNTRSVGPSATAQVNVANGNLVVQQTDSTEVQSHGQLGYVIRRTYNSQDNMTEDLPGSLGDGWQLNLGQTDSNASGGLDVAGLDIPNVESATQPASVSYIDRDGTRHVFTLKSAGVSVGGLAFVDLNVSSVLAAVQAALSNGSLLSSLSSLDQLVFSLANPATLKFGLPSGDNTLCVDAAYSPPPGVDLSLWRYIGVDSSSPGSSTGCTNLASGAPAPVVVGWTAVRSDRLRYDFSADGQLLAMTDASGNQLDYTYQNPDTVAGAVTNPGSLGDLTGVDESGCPTSSGASCPNISLAYGTTPAFGSNSNGLPDITVTDTAGRVTTYVMDGQSPVDHLTQVWDPGNPMNIVGGQLVGTPSEQYGYWTPGSTCDPGATTTAASYGLLCSVTDPDGHVTKFTYTNPPLGPAQVQTIQSPRSVASSGASGSESLFAYSVAAADTVVDTATSTVLNPSGAPSTGCANNAGCDQTLYSNIDGSGRVGETSIGNGANDYLKQTDFFWDGDQIASCRQPDNMVDNDLCQEIVRAVPTTTDAPNTATTTTVNGVVETDQETSWIYNDQGNVLSESKVRTPTTGFGPAQEDTTTYGYHDQYFEADGTVHAYDDTVAGNGQVTSTPTGANYAATVEADTPISYWKLDETTGTTAVDETGANNATYGSNVTLNQPGAIAGDAAVQTSAATPDLFTVTNPTGFTPSATTNFSLEAWIKDTSTAPIGLLSESDATGTGMSFLLSAGGTPAFELCSNSTTQNNCLQVRADVAVDDSQWHQITVTYNGSGSTPSAAIYVDGQPSGTILQSSDIAGSTVPAAGTPLTFGLPEANASADPIPADTGIDDTSIYGTALSAGQIAAQYAAATPSRVDAETLYSVSDQTEALSPRGNQPGAAWGDYLTTYRRDVPPAPAPGSTAPYPQPNTTGGATVCGGAAVGNTGLLCETDSPGSPGITSGRAGCTAPTTAPGSPPTTAGYTWVCTTAAYDHDGQKTSSTNANDDTYTYTYYQDAPTCSSDPGDCDLSGSVSAGGWLKAETDPDGNSVLFAYDRAGNQARTWDRDATKGTAVSADWASQSTTPAPNYSQTLNAQPVTDAAVAGGSTWTTALRPDGTVWTSGANAQGELGNGTTTSSMTPVHVPGLTNVVQVASTADGYPIGNAVSAALEANGSVWTWGTGSNDTLGTGSTAQADLPVQVSGLPPIIAVAAGGESMLALDDKGDVWAWGKNADGEVGNGTTSPVTTPVQVLTGVSAIAAGGLHSLAVKTDGTVWAWGNNTDGELGTGSTTSSDTPVAVPGLSGIVQVSAGEVDSYAVGLDGSVWSWGYNGDGELGTGSSATQATTPQPLTGLSGVKAVTGGGYAAAALLTNGTVYTWGSNAEGVLGQGDTANSSSPVQVAGVTGAAALTVGFVTMIAVTADGAQTAWGYDADGEFGDGETTSTDAPRTVTAGFALDPYAYPWRYQEASSDALRNETVTLTDADGNVMLTRPARGEQVYTTAYDTVSTYDADNDMVSTLKPLERNGDHPTTWTYDAFDNQTSTTGPDGDVTEMVYDSADRMVQTDTARATTAAAVADAPTCQSQASSTNAPLIPAGQYFCATSQTYDGADDVVTATDADGQTTLTTYDGVGQATMLVTPRNDGTYTDLTSVKVYDPDGNVTDVCPPRQYEPPSTTVAPACPTTAAYGTHTVYDNAGRPVTVTTYRQATTSPPQPAATLVTATGYDPDGNTVAVTDPNGNTTTTTWDALDRKTTQTVPRSTGVSEVTSWQYDPAGNTTAVLAPSNEATGNGSSGALVIDGTTAAASTDGQAHPQGNPFVVPAGASYTSVVLQNGGWITGPATGALTMTATTVTVCATCGITEAGHGQAGGAGVTGGSGATGTPGVPPGGGGAGTGGLTGAGGGGGGNNGPGQVGTSTVGTTGGAGGPGQGTPQFTFAADNPTSALGGGGGGGGEGALGSASGSGGGGGGFIHLTVAQSITIAGTVTAAGIPGGNGNNGGGGGGGGAGGGIWLTAPTVTLSAATDVTAAGGTGGNGAQTGGAGGNGAGGYIRIDADTLTGAPTGITQEYDAQVTAYSYDPDERLTDTLNGALTVQANPAVDDTADAVPDPDGGYNERTEVGYNADGEQTIQIPARAFTTAASLIAPDLSYASRTDYNLDGQATVVYQPRYDGSTGDVADPSGDAGGGDEQTAQCPTGADPQTTPGFAGYPAGVGVCTTTTSYDPAGRAVTQTRANSTAAHPAVDTTTYTLDGLVASTSTPDPQTGTGRATTTTLYDGDGQATQVTDPNGDVSTSSYTADDLVAQTQTQGYTAGSRTVSHVTDYTYNPNGQPATQTSPNAITPASGLTAAAYITTIAYTTDGLTSSVTAPGTGTGSTPTDVTSYVYDDDGNPVAIYSPSANAKDATNPGGLPTTMTYTADNLLAGQSQPVTTSTSRVTAYQYTPSGQKAAQDTGLATVSPAGYADGGTQTFTYLPDGLPASQNGRGDTGDITTTYNEDGQPASIADTTSGVTVTAGYYLDDQPRTVTDPASDDSYAYDGTGNTTVTADQPTGSTVDYTAINYDTADLPVAEASDIDPGATTTWAYDHDGNPLTQTDAHQTQTWTYNPDNTTATDDITGAGGATVDDYAYTYDNDGNPLSQTVTGTNASTAAYDYTYDPADRLTSFTDDVGTHALTWDHDSNRLTLTGPTTLGGTASTTSYTYNADDTVDTAQSTGQAAPTAYTYDPDGRLTNDGCDTYTYDGFDRLTNVTTETAPTGVGCPTVTTNSTYSYDGLDRQRTDTTTAGTTTYLYNGLTTTVDDETGITAPAGTPAGTTNRDELDPSGTPMTVATTTGTSSPIIDYLDADGLGSITDLLTANGTSPGTSACTARFDPFGDPEHAAGSNVCNSGPQAATTTNDDWYQNERRDPETGDYQLGSRTYDPANDLYTTPDGYRSSTPDQDLSVGTDPLTENRYSYVNGNPLTFIDPNGHAYICSGKICGTKQYVETATPTAARQGSAVSQLPNYLTPSAGNNKSSRSGGLLDRFAHAVGHAVASGADAVSKVVNNYGLLALTTLGEATCIDPIDGVCELDTAAEAEQVGGLLADDTGGETSTVVSDAADTEADGVSASAKDSQPDSGEIDDRDKAGKVDTEAASSSAKNEGPPVGSGTPVGGGDSVVSFSADSSGAETGGAVDLPGYSSFRAAKADLGSPGTGNVFDHVVEQSQIGRSGFAPEDIHNPFNLDPVDAQINQLKANYYSSIRPFTGGQTVRDWLTGQSFADQYNFGMDINGRLQSGLPLP
jgi:RHS repeat-associated protein